MLVFYAGFEGWQCQLLPALCIVGYFEVELAGKAKSLEDEGHDVAAIFSNNFHVRHRRVYEKEREKLVLVKGSGKSRLLGRAHQISSDGKNKEGQRLHILSEEMKQHFGSFTKINSIQRSNPRWVSEEFCERAAVYVRQLD